MNDIELIRRKKIDLNEENLIKLTKEELIEKIQSLNSHNTQLKNIILRNSETRCKSKYSNRPYDFSKCAFRHILLKLFYLGWDYRGFTTQEDSNNTIEHHLFDALTKTCLIQSRIESNYHRCGRTDKGVSSFGQVISITVRSASKSDEPLSSLENELNYCKMLNRVLPPDIRCVGWQPVEQSFSARFDCNGRTYKYFFPKANLNIEAMREASRHLIGSHDFRNFCKMDVANGVTKFVRNLVKIDIEPIDNCTTDDVYAMHCMTIVGNAFLWHQIRCIMGILLLIGQNKEKPDVIKEMLDVESNPRKPDYNMASEIPLNLYNTQYAEKSNKWFYDPVSLQEVAQALQKLWTINSVKTSMIHNMLKDITRELSESHATINHDSLIECLLQGVKAKAYIPLMKRPTCVSLEDRIAHYSKKRKFQPQAGRADSHTEI